MELEKTHLIPTDLEKALVSFELALKSLFFGRKWVIFLILGLFPLTFTLLVEDRLLGSPDVRTAFVDFFIGFQYILFFTFSCLILSLPMSADEISDHVIDLYLVRPVKREILWGARWLAANVSVFLLNFGVAIIYYLYLHVVIEDFAGITDDLDLLSSAFVFLIAATLAYAGLFLLVGFIGNRGFTLGVLLAIFELFLLSMLFLQDEPAIPRTNICVIADSLFDINWNAIPFYSFNESKAPDLLFAWGYVGLLAIGSLVAGALYLRIREFN